MIEMWEAEAITDAILGALYPRLVETGALSDYEFTQIMVDAHSLLPRVFPGEPSSTPISAAEILKIYQQIRLFPPK